MYNFFIFFCFVCFCIVLAAIAAFTFDVAMLRGSAGPIYGAFGPDERLAGVGARDRAEPAVLSVAGAADHALGTGRTRPEMAAVDLSLRRRALLRPHPRRAGDHLYVASPAGTGRGGGESS